MSYRFGEQFGNYRLVRLLGEGGFAQVYLAEHVFLKKLAAVKVLHSQVTEDALATFLDEAQTITRLEHPHIVHVIDFGVANKIPYLVMNYAPNGTLRQRHCEGSRLPLSMIVNYLKQIAPALHYAHTHKVIHRDIKPENMLIGLNDEILLSDFGIAVVFESTSFQSTLNQAGTLAYMAPEQYQGKPRPDSDQYALGVVVYEWMCGQRPFHGTTLEIAMQHQFAAPPPLREKIPTISPELEQVVLKALNKDPEQRFASVQAFAAALQQASAATTLFHKSAPFVASQPVSLTSFNSSTAPLLTPSTFTPSPVSQQPVIIAEIEGAIPPQSKSPLMPSLQKTPAIQLVEQPPVPQHRLTKRYLNLALVMGIVLLLAGGSYTYLALNSSMQTVKTIPSATPATAYDAEVATHGIMFGFDAQHSHDNPYEHILNVTNVSQLEQQWTALTSGLIYSSPAVANGLVYVGSIDHRLYAFDAMTGVQKWVSPPTDSYITSSPAVANGLVYVGSIDYRLYAFDAMTGVQKWASSTTASIYSSPAVANGLVYVGSDHNLLYAFDATTGAQKWVSPPFNTGHSSSSPVVANGLIYIGSTDDRLYAFDAITGAQKWAPSTGGQIWSSPVVANGFVYVGSFDHMLYAFHLPGTMS
ncbi:MAG: PQQ-binding-like beta-propeller repeat protein [Chloroflexi bacterium]|nr:PQQ-binding-like beta-propeller repeat protein [Chloroflexota bacterium]